MHLLKQTYLMGIQWAALEMLSEDDPICINLLQVLKLYM